MIFLWSWAGNSVGVGAFYKLVQGPMLRVSLAMCFSANVHLFLTAACFCYLFLSKFAEERWMIARSVCQSVCKTDPGQHCQGWIDPTGEMMCLRDRCPVWNVRVWTRGSGGVGLRYTVKVRQIQNRSRVWEPRKKHVITPWESSPALQK